MTQNPSDHIGTTLLPESELDRFTTRISLGPPDVESEKAILMSKPHEKFDSLEPVLGKEELVEIQNKVSGLHVSDSILTLVTRFLNSARSRDVMLSPRAGKDIVRVAQALSFIRLREHVLPEDVKRAMKYVIEHRTRNADALISDFSFEA